MPNTIVASQIMQRTQITVRPQTSVMDAAERLLKHRISGAPVVDDAGALVAILSEFDCIRHISHCAMTNTPPGWVEDVMVRDVETVAPDVTLLAMVGIFDKRRYRRLPVVDAEGRLLGQVSRRDVLRALSERMKTVTPKKGDGPLYLSAIYDRGEAPAKVTE